MIRTAQHLCGRLILHWRLRRDPIGYARSIGVEIGSDCRLLDLKLGTFGTEPYLIKLGDHVTVTAGVKFLTHDGGVWVFRNKYPDIDVVAPIVVGNNVFIGINVLILPGVTIGDNCVVGAGAVVSRDIPSGSVAVGIPAQRIKSLDEYWDKVKDRAFHVRGLPENKKRSLFKRHFWPNEV